MNKLGYYAKDKDNNLHQFEWSKDNKLLIITPLGKIESDPKDYEILEIGYFTADDNYCGVCGGDASICDGC